mgnify:CR=1 FL=1|tara:strand:+ start:1670 stop:2005 length:336 start_codon:yes stop_codon:yes gene_type:complete
MSNRYNKSKTFINTDETYEEVFEDRGVNDIPQYATRVFRQLTPAQRRTIKTEKYVWKTGDKYYKLASKYYGDPTYWWVIAQFNFAPTEAHLYVGRVLTIPLSLEEILRYYR